MTDFLKDLGVKQKIMLLSGVSIFIAMVFLGVILNKVITDNVRNTFEDDAKVQAVQVDNTMNVFLMNLEAGLANLASEPAMRQGGDITKYMDGPAADSGEIAMDPMAKGGFEAATYQAFQRYAEAFNGTISTVS